MKLGHKAVGKAVVFSVLLFLEFVLVESYEHNPFSEVRAEAIIFNIILVELLGWFLFACFGKAKIALWIESGLIMLFGLTNHYVMEFRSTPFVPWDILSISTAKSVAGDYQFTFPPRVIIVTLLFVAIIIFAFFFQFDFKKVVGIRLGFGFIMLCCLIVMGKALQNEDFQTKHYLYPFLFTPAYMTKVNGMLVTFTMNLAYIIIDKPAGYDTNHAKELLESYHVAKEVEVEELPNVIVIMDEAFSDLGVLGNFETNEDYMPFVHSLQAGYENTITGKLAVSVCGGNTANSEFEFLTGNSMAFLPTGSIPYQQYVKGECPSLASHLTNLGYETYAFHPYYAGGWSRETVYPYLGFEKSYFLRDMIMAEKIRDYVSDKSDFNEIIDLYEAKTPGKPAFIFNVTMQNHGSYGDAFPNFEPDVKVEGSDAFALEQYLSLVKETDKQFKSLLQYFMQEKEKTVIVFFGDHQPNDYVANCMLKTLGKKCDDLTEEEQHLRYQVPYVIWANYDIREGSDENTSANYLAAKALEAAGIPTSDYMNYLLDLKERYPIISSVYVEKEDGENFSPSEEKKGLNEYQALQYYQLFDWEGK